MSTGMPWMSTGMPWKGHGELHGVQHPPKDLAAFVYAAGWTDAHDLATAVMVILGESAGWDRAIHYNDPSEKHPSGTTDKGLWQINTGVWKAVTDDVAYDPVASTRYAREHIWAVRQSFRPWNAFTNGSYLRHREVALAGVHEFLAEHFDTIARSSTGA